MLSRMEATGADCGGNPLSGPAPRLFKGAAATPAYEPRPLQISRLRQKVEAGARYIQTQGVFDLDQFRDFLEDADKAGIRIPIMAGIIPLKSAGMARFMNRSVPGIAVPEEVIARLDAAPDGQQAGMEQAAELIARIREEKLCAGVHIMAVGAERNVPKILELAGIHSFS